MAARAGTPLPHRSTGNTGSPPIALKFDFEGRLYVHANFRTQADWSGCSRHVFLIHLAIASSCIPVLGQGCGRPDLRTQSFWLDPLTTLLASRSARGALELERSKIEMCGANGGECLNPDASIGFFQSHIRRAP